MERRTFLAMVPASLLVAPRAAVAQPATKAARIGFLSISGGRIPTMDISPGLRELGWIEGQNIAIEYRWAANREDQLPALGAELVRLKVEVIVTSGTPAAQAAKRATTTIPIVMTFVADPVGSGLVSSLARPGGNVTGLTTLATGLIAKRLELLKAMVSGSTRVAVLWQPGALGERAMRDLVEETQVAGRTLGLTLRFVEARRPEDFDQAFSAMREARVGGLLVFPNALLFEERKSIVEHATKGRLPAMYPWREAASVGGLMSYSTNFPDMYRRAATYVDKILKGAKPGDLPIEQPTTFELVLNLKTAKALRLKIPSSLLARADQVIE